MSEESLRSYLKEEVKKLEKKIDYTKILKHSVMTGENKALVKYMSSWEYVWNMFQAIEEGEYKHSLHELVFELAVGGNSQRECTGKIDIRGTTLYLSKDSFDYLENPEKFREFVREFHRRNSSCKFSSLAVNSLTKNVGHRNMFFFYRTGSGITASIYDPHGWDSESVHIRNVNKFAETFVRTYNGMFSKQMTLLERMDVSCPVGLQDASEPGSGYCVIYSYLWFYFVCKVGEKMNRDESFVRAVFKYISGQDDNITFALKNVERNMIEILSDKEILDLVHNFAVMIVNSYIEIVTERYPSEKKEFISRLEKDMEKILITEKEEDTFTKTRYNKPIQKLKRNPETGYEESSRGRDGAFCISDDDCLSDHCVDGKCTPYDFREKKPR